MLFKFFIGLMVFLFLAGVLIVILTRRPLYKGPISDHFNGKHFYYKERFHSFRDMLKWAWEMKTVKWPEWIVDRPQPKPEPSVQQGEIKVTYINHGTVLIQLDGLNILTDPTWANRAGPFGKIGPKRVRLPGVRLEDLPKIDIILISHDHYDHLDFNTLRILERYKPRILVGLGVKSLLKPSKFANVIEMDWWQEYTMPANNTKITFVPARHYSGRTMIGNNRTLWGGFVIQGTKGNIYYAGDTGYDEFLNQIKERFGKFRLTILPIGSYEKRWYMKTQHINPEDAVLVHLLLESRQSMGYHYATFAEHPEQTIDSHEKDLAIALEKYNISKMDFWIMEFGEGRYLAE